MWKQSGEELNGLNKQHGKCCWELSVDVRTCGRWRMCRAGCLCVVIYSAINNLTCFFLSSSPGWRRSGGTSTVVAQVYYPYYLPPAVAHFPHGGLNDEQTLQTNAAAYFF